METKLIELYLLICRLYNTRPVLKQQRLSNNHAPLFSDEELLTIYLFGHMQGHTTQRRIYDYIRQHWRAWFPSLPSYQSINCRLNELVPAFELLIEELLSSGAGPVLARDARLIDSVPVMLARGTRANRSRVAAELADTGFCATKQQHYRGVKLHFVAARRVKELPLPEKIHLSQAAMPDLQALREMRPNLPAGCGLFADKAYFHDQTQRDCSGRGFFLVAAYKRHRHEPEGNVPTLFNRFVSAIRQPLESLFNWLIQRTDLQNASRVRSTQGLKVHCYGKLAVACLLLTLYS
ncbi:MAG: IS982 family transposase [Pyrinomonadaceae bacterium]|nr:IS982 family transposase [Pyrinomonadaceae bacterium]